MFFTPTINQDVGNAETYINMNYTYYALISLSPLLLFTVHVFHKFCIHEIRQECTITGPISVT